jgi:Fe-S-cluster containining protein
MTQDMEPFFEEYRLLAATAEKTFETVKASFPDYVKCRPKCTDCCYAIFDISLIEALIINLAFNSTFEGKAKYDMVEKANRIDRKLHQIKRSAYKEFQGGKDENSILTDISKIKIRCPLLNDQDMCDLYESRPITCRLYGIPTAIGGKGRTCGLSGFKAGESYPTVQLEKIHSKLYDISNAMIHVIGSRHTRMGELLMPVSMAILTDFNEEYMGIDAGDDSEKEQTHE